MLDFKAFFKIPHFLRFAHQHRHEEFQPILPVPPEVYMVIGKFVRHIYGVEFTPHRPSHH